MALLGSSCPLLGPMWSQNGPQNGPQKWSKRCPKSDPKNDPKNYKKSANCWSQNGPNNCVKICFFWVSKGQKMQFRVGLSAFFTFSENVFFWFFEALDWPLGLVFSPSWTDLVQFLVSFLVQFWVPRWVPKWTQKLTKQILFWVYFWIPFFGGFGALWGPLGSLLGPLEALLGGLRSEKMQTVQRENHFLKM